jgi:osmotically-inducible protein OsmY
MKNKQNSYDRTGSSQDFSNNEGLHNYQEYTDRGFKNAPHYPEKQGRRQDRPGYRNEGSGYGSGSSQSDRFDASYNANHGYGATSTPRHEYESSRFGQGEAHPASNSSGNFSWQGEQEHKSGLHAGKGPKGYRRSDERIREEVSEVLRAHGEIDASEIEIDVKEGMVALTGTVESRQMKRLIEDTVEAVSGVQDVKNELRLMTSIENAKSTLSDTTADSTSSRSSSLAKSGLTGRQSPTSQSTSVGKSVQ